MNATTVRLDWQAKHGPIWATLNVALALVATATVAERISIGGQTMALIGAGCLAVAVFTTFAAFLAGRSLARSIATGALLFAGAVWVLVARVNPRSTGTLGVLVLVAVCVGIMAWLWSRRVDKKAAEANAARVAQAARGATERLAREWEKRLTRVCKVDGRVRSLKPWPNKTGFTMAYLPDEGGTTVNDIAAAASRLAADARLPNGCGVEVLPGEHRGEVLLKVSTVNALAQEQPYPRDLSSRSIYQPLEVGVRRDATASSIALRYASAVMAGQKGGGKTNRLHVITAQLARCTDVLTWHIDLTGGLSLPWVQPWLEHRAAAPGVDWVAGTVEEAQLMLDGALAIVRGRKPAYRERMRQANDDKLPIDATVPAIVVVVDEFASLPRNLQATVIKLSDEGRGPGVQTVACALRGTVDYLPRELLVQAANRIAMRGSDESELAHVMGWGPRLDPSEVPYPGCGFVLSAEDVFKAPRPDRAYRITPAQVDDVVTGTAKYRPRLDEVSAKLADTIDPEAYPGRWNRFLAEAEAIRERGHTRLTTTVAEHRATRPAAIEIRTDLADPTKWPTPKGVTYQRSDAHTRLLALLTEALPNGLQPGQLHARLIEEKFETERQTVHKWLALEMSRGTVRQPVDRGPYYAVVEEPATAVAETAA